MNTDRFQGICLASTEGHQTMAYFDDLPKNVRAEVRNSPFNLCPICLDVLFHNSVAKMEAQIRAEESKQ